MLCMLTAATARVRSTSKSLYKSNAKSFLLEQNGTPKQTAHCQKTNTDKQAKWKPLCSLVPQSVDLTGALGIIQHTKTVVQMTLNHGISSALLSSGPFPSLTRPVLFSQPPFTAALREAAALPGELLPFEEKQCYSLCTHHVDANKLQGCEVSRLLIQIAPSPTQPSASPVYSRCCTEEPHWGCWFELVHIHCHFKLLSLSQFVIQLLTRRGTLEIYCPVPFLQAL